jgi:hypothetical protein
MWIGDVGDMTIEEIDVIPAGSGAGKNFGWDMWEGTTCSKPPCDLGTMTFPQVERTHTEGWSAMIGGQVYRGSCYPDLVGTYLYANFGNPGIATARLQTDGSVVSTDIKRAAGDPAFPAGPASIHADARGELYLTATTGAVYHVEAHP